MTGAAVFRVPGHQHSAKMIKADLHDARALWLAKAQTPADRRRRAESSFYLYRDGAGRYLDFHALRHTRGVWLFEHHKAHPREVQELMGVSSLTLVDRYTRSFRLTDLSVIERGPDLSAPAGACTEAQPARATGTDGAGVARTDVAPSNLSPESESRRSAVESDGVVGASGATGNGSGSRPQTEGNSRELTHLAASPIVLARHPERWQSG